MERVSKLVLLAKNERSYTVDDDDMDKALEALTELPDDQAATVIARWALQTGYNLDLIEEFMEEEG